jgi:hypothetical protein
MGKTWREVKVIAGSTVCWYCLAEALCSQVEYQEIKLTATERKYAQQTDTVLPQKVFICNN